MADEKAQLWADVLRQEEEKEGGGGGGGDLKRSFDKRWSEYEQAVVTICGEDSGIRKYLGARLAAVRGCYEHPRGLYEHANLPFRTAAAHHLKRFKDVGERLRKSTVSCASELLAHGCTPSQVVVLTVGFKCRDIFGAVPDDLAADMAQTPVRGDNLGSDLWSQTFQRMLQHAHNEHVPVGVEVQHLFRAAAGHALGSALEVQMPRDVEALPELGPWEQVQLFLPGEAAELPHRPQLYAHLLGGDLEEVLALIMQVQITLRVLLDYQRHGGINMDQHAFKTGYADITLERITAVASTNWLFHAYGVPASFQPQGHNIVFVSCLLRLADRPVAVHTVLEMPVLFYLFGRDRGRFLRLLRECFIDRAFLRKDDRPDRPDC